jgi:argininosuccinate lyase
LIAKTDAAGGPQLHPEALAFTSSLELDRALLKEDLVGSMAHVVMLGRQRILEPKDARAVRDGLGQLWLSAQAGTWAPAGEEDVHMAVEAALDARLGAVAGLLHTARSRNDQVALDLRLFTRAQCADALKGLAQLVSRLLEMAQEHADTMLPSYTHRQRAQPISLAYWLCAYAAMFSRDMKAFDFALDGADALPLGVGAIAGTSLPIDRDVTRELLQFSRLTENGLDTVGDRDFALDFLYAAARCAVHVSRLCTDLIDFASSEFGFVRLSDAIACGSSMMPQKRNPDLFELLRGKSGPAVGDLMSLLVTLKGLPGGYNRDLQEDRRVVLSAGPALCANLRALLLGLGNVQFDKERCLAALEGGATQATDVAEALVGLGVPFREAYQAVGTLVAKAQKEGLPLSTVPLEMARAIHPGFTAQVWGTLDPRGSVGRKVNEGGTGPASIARQMETLRQSARLAQTRAEGVPSLEGLFKRLSEVGI